MTPEDEQALLERLSAVRSELLEVAEHWEPWLPERHSDRDASARNLLQYLALRRHDLRDVQYSLIELGLSSMGGNEGHVQASIDAVLAALRALTEHSPGSFADAVPAPIGFTRSRDLLGERAEALLGPARRQRPTRIMVTMPSSAADDDDDLMRDLLDAGMDGVRINCAHDDRECWVAMCEHLREAERRTGGSARIFVDLPGPKLRTGPLYPETTRDAKGPYLRLRTGDTLLLTRPGTRKQAVAGETMPTQVVCSLEEAFVGTERGHHVWFDDGKLGGVVESVATDTIGLRITVAGNNGSKLRPGKGINLPDAALSVDLLGAHSQAALHFAAHYADVVELSFITRARDVKRVSEYLDEHSRAGVGVVLKVETQRAFDHLPAMLLAALGTGRPAGVMIARGDLAIECGYERLAEVQEEILSLCQAAHVPVIWATQVLDQLAKTGRPSRAEITDAAMAGRAECVMLNKGPQIVDAVRVLDDILRRMERHHRKQRRLLPKLKAADYLPGSTAI